MITRCRPLLGTFVEITVPADCSAAADQAFSAIAALHTCMSFHDDASDLGRLRCARPGTPVSLNPATVAVLRFAGELFEASGGLFDVAIGRALVRAGFLPRGTITRLGDYPGTGADIHILDDTHVMLTRPTLIDLGGIAKGYAVDSAVTILAERGIDRGMVNAGGDLRCFGPDEWQIALRDADEAVRYMTTVQNCALASSANLRQRRRYRGAEQSPHIGRDGCPVLSDYRTSVMAPTCMIADAMTKIAMADSDLAQRLHSRYGSRLLPSQPEEALP